MRLGFCSLCSLFVLFWTTPAAASDAKPTEITVLVMDEADAPIRNALAEVKCTERGKATSVTKAKSGADGRVRLEAILLGACAVKVAAPGFTSRVVAVRRAGRRAEIEIGKVRLKISCSGAGIICDEVMPKGTPTSEKE